MPEKGKTTETTVVVTPPSVAVEENKSRLGKLKLAFLYVLIGGLVLSALISVTAILIGEFNSIITKAILTTVSLVIHSTLTLLIVLADKKNQLGKTIMPTTLLVVVIANMITSSLGLWDVWGNDLSWRMVNVYAFVIGIAFLVEGLLKLRLRNQLMQVLPYISIGLVFLLAVCFIPWILFFDASWITDLYYRIITAIAILAVTAIVITTIMNRIAIAQHPQLRTAPQPATYTGGMLGILITLGVFTSFFWFYGFIAFVYQASTYGQHHTNTDSYSPTYQSYDRARRY